MKRQVIIIGGGASGLAAAIAAAREGAEVTILEHMDRVGKKILSTGNRTLQSDQSVSPAGALPLQSAAVSHEGAGSLFCLGYAGFF